MQKTSRAGWSAILGIFVAGILTHGSQLYADDTNASNEPPTIKLTISPAPEPVPALKYRLLPALADQTQGNAALDYDRALLQFESTERLSRFAKLNKIESFTHMPIEKLPMDELANMLQPYDSIFEQIERGSHRRNCEWQVPVVSNGYGTALMEFQELRQPARLIAVRARLQMARGDFEGALASLQTNLKLGRDMSEGRLLITSLVGIAIASISTDQLETFIQRPDAPNLYWALTQLPTPFIEMRSAIESEALILDYEFPQLASLRSQGLSRATVRRLSDALLEKWRSDNPNVGSTFGEARTRFAAVSVMEYSRGKRALIEAGRPKAEVEAMPVEQVMWLASYRRWEVLRDDLFRWAAVPIPQRTHGMDSSVRRMQSVVAQQRDPVFELTHQFMPAIQAALAAADRQDRHFALLRIVEAIRLYAHDHHGELPQSLGRIDIVPIPADPATGKPFSYRLDGGSAVLETPRTADYRYEGRRYVIQIRK